MYSPNPEHPSGLPSDEVYRLTQGQRRRERDIRQTKRELAGAQLIADKDASLANVAEVERLKGEAAQAAGGTARIHRRGEPEGRRARAPTLAEPRVGGRHAADQKTDASRRTMKEFMEGDG